MATVTVRVIKSDFARGVKYAKRMGGIYDSSTKTYEIPADRPELGNVKAYGLERIELPGGAGTDSITDNQYVEAGGALGATMDDEHSAL